MRSQNTTSGIILWILGLLIPMTLTASKKDVDRKVFDESMRIIAYFFPDSSFCISDSLYSFNGGKFIPLVDRNTIRNIESYSRDSLLTEIQPKYCSILCSLSRKYSKVTGSKQRYHVRFSIPYKGMVSCEVGPYKEFKEEKGCCFLFRFYQHSGKVYNTTRLIVDSK